MFGFPPPFRQFFGSELGRGIKIPIYGGTNNWIPTQIASSTQSVPVGSIKVRGLFFTYVYKFIPPAKPIGSGDRNLPNSES